MGWISVSLFLSLQNKFTLLWLLPQCHLSWHGSTFLRVNRKVISSRVLRCLLCWLLAERKKKHNWDTIWVCIWLDFFPSIWLCSATLWKCIEMRACMLLYLLCACDAIRTPLLSIICGVSVPHSARPQWGYFSQPSIQTWPITARLQKHFPCTQELTAVNGGYFQSLCCQSKCQVNTGQWKQL